MWILVVDEELYCRREIGNISNLYAVASYKSATSLVTCQAMSSLHVKEVLLYPGLLTHYCIPVICPRVAQWYYAHLHFVMIINW